MNKIEKFLLQTHVDDEICGSSSLCIPPNIDFSSHRMRIEDYEGVASPRWVSFEIYSGTKLFRTFMIKKRFRVHQPVSFMQRRLTTRADEAEIG